MEKNHTKYKILSEEQQADGSVILEIKNSTIHLRSGTIWIDFLIDNIRKFLVELSSQTADSVEF